MKNGQNIAYVRRNLLTVAASVAAACANSKVCVCSFIHSYSQFPVSTRKVVVIDDDNNSDKMSPSLFVVVCACVFTKRPT